MNWTAFGVIGSALLGLAGVLASTWASRKADQSGKTTKLIEVGVQDLVVQLREQNKGLDAEVHECKKECEQLRSDVVRLERKIGQLETDKDNLEAEVIRLTKAAGEL